MRRGVLIRLGDELLEPVTLDPLLAAPTDLDRLEFAAFSPA